MIYGLVAPSYEMTRVVAAYFDGEEKKFNGFDMSTKLKLLGLDVASLGNQVLLAPGWKKRKRRDLLHPDLRGEGGRLRPARQSPSHANLDRLHVCEPAATCTSFA
jgi:hypothetical protein